MISPNIISKVKQSNSNIDNIEGRVKQRLTFNKNNSPNNSYREHSFLNIYNKKTIYIGFRVSLEYLEKLDIIARILRTKSLSETLRESINIAYGILSGAKEIEAGTVIVQNPIVNIVKAESSAKAESGSKTEINIDFSEIIKLISRLYKLRDPLPPLQKKLIEKLYQKISEKVMN